MNESVKNVLLWVGVLPGAIIGALLATFPLHWILYGTLVEGSIISGVDIEPIERFLSPFVVALTFILIGSYIAPNTNLKQQLCLLSSISFPFYPYSFLY